MIEPPERLPIETQQAYQAFCSWVGDLPRLALVEFSRATGIPHDTVRGWSSRHSWPDRASAHDRALLSQQIARREADRELARQALVDALPEAVALVMALARGEAGPDGDQTPLLDRHGAQIGTRPVVSPTTRMRAAQDILDRAGLIIPKRMELTGPNGQELKIQARHALSDLSGDQLAALAKIFGVDL